MASLLSGKERNFEKLSKNAQKMRDLEEEMTKIEESIETIKSTLQKNRVDDQVSQKDIDDTYQQICEMTVEMEKDLKTRVNERFVKTFEEEGKKLYDSECALKSMKNRKYELESLLSEYKSMNALENEKNNQIDKAMEELKGEYKYINESYNEYSKENIILERELSKKNNLIAMLVNKSQELKEILGKLSEVKVMLNKYFSSHFENFSEKEKEIIENLKQLKSIQEIK